MAEIFLSPLIQVLLERLSSAVVKGFDYIWGLERQVKDLQAVFLKIEAILEDAEEQQVTHSYTRLWLLKLKESAFVAENFLDEFTFEPSRSSVLRGRNIATKLSGMVSELHKLAGEAPNLLMRDGFVDRRPETKSMDRRPTVSSVIESRVYGRGEDKEKIATLLQSNPATTSREVSVIPIVGMGGLGKTTLAQLVYNDETISKYFDLKMWVWVSDNFNIKKIVEEAIESGMKKRCELASGMDALHSQLQDLLRGKRYLLVLDDIWNEDGEAWDDLRAMFRGSVEGSKIMVTTRSKKVAGMVGTNTPYHLKGLSDEDCWKVFEQRAFGPGEKEEHPNLLPIGKEIVNKCGGVPLAAKTLGSLLHFKTEEREWLRVKKSELWNLGISQLGILPALRLSYNHLPPHLKRCFAFCSVFPKRYEIKKDKLIYLWMAEGLIKSERESKQPEETGNEYFNGLMWMSFLEPVKNCEDGCETAYKMHDLIHDLARSVGGNDSVILEHQLQLHHLPPAGLSLIRQAYVALGDFKSSQVVEALRQAKHLRTLLLYLVGDIVEPLRDIPSYFKYLHMVDLSGCDISSLPVSIGYLRFLRYLDLSYTPIISLCGRCFFLRHLQTLNLINCHNLVELRDDVAIMQGLRHLNISGCQALLKTPRYMGRLRSLHVLPIYIVHRDSGRHISELECLDLHGELKIKHLENVIDASEAMRVQLRMKEKLESLGLYWGDNDDGLNIHRANMVEKKEHQLLGGPSQVSNLDAQLGEAVLGALQPHGNLKRLFVKGFPGISFPLWTLPNLTVFDLFNCQRCKNLPILGNLPSLKILSLQRMNDVSCIGREFYGEAGTSTNTCRPFPSLRELVLRDFPNLKEWSSSNYRDAFPNLIKLIISGCPSLTKMPLFFSVQHLELRDCNLVILESVENLTFLSNLVIEKVLDLSSLPREFLAKNPFLRSLEIISCPKLRSLHLELGNPNALKSLTIRWCEELSSLPQGLQNLKALESLEISNCNNIISMPEDAIGGLSSLRTLSIENCNNLSSLSTSFQHLTSLEHLTVMYCPNLGALPEDMQHLVALRSLTILSCPQFSSLPEGLKYATTLHSLEIHSCPGLAALPEWVENLASLKSLTISDCGNMKHLPEGLKLLSELQHISIQDCPELEERCKPRSGEGWLKIAHIPYKRIGSREPRQSSRANTYSG